MIVDLELHVWYQGCDLINSIQGHPPSCHLCVSFRGILTWRILTLFLHASNRIPDHNLCPLLTRQENSRAISVIFIGSMIEPHFTHHTGMVALVREWTKHHFFLPEQRCRDAGQGSQSRTNKLGNMNWTLSKPTNRGVFHKYGLRNFQAPFKV